MCHQWRYSWLKGNNHGYDVINALSPQLFMVRSLMPLYHKSRVGSQALSGDNGITSWLWCSANINCMDLQKIDRSNGKMDRWRWTKANFMWFFHHINSCGLRIPWPQMRQLMYVDVDAQKAQEDGKEDAKVHGKHAALSPSSGSGWLCHRVLSPPGQHHTLKLIWFHHVSPCFILAHRSFSKQC